MAGRFNLGKLVPDRPRPDAVALIDGRDLDAPRAWSQREVDELADACARALVKRGLARGDRVAILGMNGAAYVIAYLGIMRAGLVAVPVNHKLAEDTIRFVLADCEARLAFTDDSEAARLPEGLPRVPLEGDGWASFLDPGPFEAVTPAPRECAMILYTSGSTGRPKGVVLSHAGQLWALETRLRARASFEEERLIVAAPLFHMNALVSCKFALAAGASLVLLPRFEPKAFIRALGDFGVTWITSVPTMMAMVVRESEALAKIDRARMRYVRMGSASATPQLYEAVKAVFPNAALAGGYGSTEAGPTLIGPLPGKPLPGDDGLGWPLPGVETRIVDAAGHDVEEGDLWIRCPANMEGYLNLPDRTREVLTGDGWYRSGDVFRRDATGCLYFVGRVDDRFKCGGESIYPGEVEHVIERLPEVMQAAVVPVPDELKGAKPVAFVVLAQGARLTESQVKEFALAHAPAYQHPRRVFFLPVLPLAATNKIDRRSLQIEAQRRCAEPHAIPDRSLP